MANHREWARRRAIFSGRSALRAAHHAVTAFKNSGRPCIAIRTTSAVRTGRRPRRAHGTQLCAGSKIRHSHRLVLFSRHALPPTHIAAIVWVLGLSFPRGSRPQRQSFLLGIVAVES
jgi:hypothetical protein